MATIIASQAIISGVFSLTKQAMQLGFLPRLSMVHTSEMAEGQVYLPEVNLMMLVAAIILALLQLTGWVILFIALANGRHT